MQRSRYAVGFTYFQYYGPNLIFKKLRKTPTTVQVAIHQHLFCTEFHKLHGLVAETAV